MARIDSSSGAGFLENIYESAEERKEVTKAGHNQRVVDPSTQCSGILFYLCLSLVTFITNIFSIYLITITIIRKFCKDQISYWISFKERKIKVAFQLFSLHLIKTVLVFLADMKRM